MAELSSKSVAPATVAEKMEELRLKCGEKVSSQMQGIDRSTDLFSKSMESILQRVHDAVANQAELGKLKRRLREEEGALVKAIAEKNGREAGKLFLMESLSSSRARANDLEKILEDQRARKNQYSVVISQQCRDLIDAEDKISQNSEVRQIQESISWYNRALGFRIDCGHGIKFIFTNINSKNPEEEFSFTIRHSNETYSVLDCEPALAGMRQLVQELNKTNGLFKFVRTIRGKFLEAAASGATSQSACGQQEASIITANSNPFSLTSSNTRSETPVKGSNNTRVSKKLHQRGGEETVLSPGSASLPPRSPRLRPSHGPVV